MNNAKINDLIKKFNIEDVENHLLYAFLEKKRLEYSRSRLIANKLTGFEIDPKLITQVTSLEVSDLKQLENCLELLIPKDDRKLNGAFFTPNYVVDFIINEISPAINDKCLDPSCGCGAFLIGLVEYYKIKYNKSIKDIISDNIYGADILAYNVQRSKVLLAILGLLNNEIVEEGDFNIEVKDSLDGSWGLKYEVIVGNPPYVKYQDLNDETRVGLLNKWQSIEKGTFNLYFAFFELGYNLLRQDGKLGYITPNNYFTSLSGVSLRKYLHQKKCLYRILDFSHKKVFEAQTYTAISFLNKKNNDAILYDRIKDEQNCREFVQKANGSVNQWDNLNDKKWRLLMGQEQENIKIIENIGVPIKKLFKISAGIATLKDEVFFVDSKNEENGCYVKKTEKGTFFIEKEVTKPVYKISNFKAQEDIENNTLRIITPYHINDNVAVAIGEAEFKVRFPKCYEYLVSEKQKLAGRDKGKKQFMPFYAWGRTQGIARMGQRLLSPTFSKHPRFLLVPEENSYFTNGYGTFLNFTDDKSLLFDEEISWLSLLGNIKLVQKIFNSVIMDYYVSKTSVSIQGGFYCYQKNFIEKFSIPFFTKQDLAELNSLNNKADIDKFLINKYQLNIPAPNRLSYTSSSVVTNP